MRVRLIILLTICVSGVGAAACHQRQAAEQPVGGKTMAKDIAEGVQRQLDVKVTVECPGDIEREKGGEFECMATAEDGSEVPVGVEQTDDKGNITWSTEALPTAPIERSISEDIFSKRAIRVEVECPEIVKLDPGFDFECLAKDDQDRQTPVKATVEDESGNVVWET
jgi:hypothetical protein